MSAVDTIDGFQLPEGDTWLDHPDFPGFAEWAGVENVEPTDSDIKRLFEAWLEGGYRIHVKWLEKQ